MRSCLKAWIFSEGEESKLSTGNKAEGEKVRDLKESGEGLKLSSWIAGKQVNGEMQQDGWGVLRRTHLR